MKIIQLGIMSIALMAGTSQAGLVGHWTFEEDMSDATGNFTTGTTYDGATVSGGQLHLTGGSSGSWASAGGYTGTALSAKTIVTWVYIDDLDMPGGGSVGSLVKDSTTPNPSFDGIVYGEREAKTWMAGSEAWNRTADPVTGNAVETADSETLVQMAIVYNTDNSIDIYRNGDPYDSYTKGSLLNYDDPTMHMVWGLRHTQPNLSQTASMPKFAGRIEETRLYDEALTQEEIQALVPEPSSIVLVSLGGLAIFSRKCR